VPEFPLVTDARGSRLRAAAGEMHGNYFWDAG